MNDDYDTLSNWELVAHVMQHEDAHVVDKQALGIFLGHLYKWREEALIDEELVDDLLASLIASYVRSHYNYFTPSAQKDDPMDGEGLLAKFRDMFNISEEDGDAQGED